MDAVKRCLTFLGRDAEVNIFVMYNIKKKKKKKGVLISFKIFLMIRIQNLAFLLRMLRKVDGWLNLEQIEGTGKGVGVS
jgi:hypothetical protein